MAALCTTGRRRERVCRRAGCAPWLAVLTPKVAAQGSGHSQDLKEASDEEVNDDKRSSGEKKRKEARPTPWALGYHHTQLRVCEHALQGHGLRPARV